MPNGCAWKLTIVRTLINIYKPTVILKLNFVCVVALKPNLKTMKSITIPGDPHSVTSVMVSQTEDFHDHEIVQLVSSDGTHTAEKKIFRVVDGGEDQWELQFE